MGSSTDMDDKASTIHSFEDVSKVEAMNEKAAIQVTPPPPALDGGSRAWIQVVGSFLVFSNLWGFTFAFGSFQTYYELDYLAADSPSNISWIGTVSTFLLIVGGVISGPLFDLGYFRTMLFVGAATQTFGVFMLSLCTKYYQIFLAQGIVIGLGTGLLYLPGLALVGRSFKKHRAMAMGITTCGAPTGGIIFTLIFEQLIARYEFGWTVRVMGFLMVGTYIVSFPLLLWGVHNLGDIASGTPRKLIDMTAFRDLPFWSYSFSNFFIFCGYMVPFVYIASYGQIQIGMSRSWALYTIMIAQASSVLGRLVAGYTAARVGVMIPWTICSFTSGILCIAWIGAKTSGSFIAYAALYGCFSGALIPLPPSIFPVVCPDPKVLGARLGMAQAIGSVASLIGSPIAGALSEIGATEDRPNYIGLQLFSGLIMVTGSMSLCGLWTLLIRRREVGKLI